MDAIVGGGDTGAAMYRDGWLAPLKPLLVVPEVQDPAAFHDDRYPFLDPKQQSLFELEGMAVHAEAEQQVPVRKAVPHPCLLDCCRQEVRVIGAGIEVQVVLQVLAAEMMIPGQEPLQRAAAVTDDDLQPREVVEHARVLVDHHRDVLFGHVVDLVVMGNGLQAPIGARGRMDHQHRA